MNPIELNAPYIFMFVLKLKFYRDGLKLEPKYEKLACLSSILDWNFFGFLFINKKYEQCLKFLPELMSSFSFKYM